MIHLLDEEWAGLRYERKAQPDGISHNHCELTDPMLVLHQSSGREVRVESSGEIWQFEVSAGRFDYYPVGLYEGRSSGADIWEGYVVHIPTAFQNCVLAGRGARSLSVPWFQFQDRRLENLVMALIKVSHGTYGAIEAVMLSASIVDRLHEITTLSKPGAASPMFSDTVSRLIEEYLDMYVSEDFDIERIAFLCGLARTQAVKAFRATFGSPVHQYLLRRRVDVAVDRLLCSPVTVTELAHELGFSSHAHFSTVFRKRLGMSPTEFRLAHRRANSLNRPRETVA